MECYVAMKISIWNAAYEEWDQGKAGLLRDKCEEKYATYLDFFKDDWIATLNK